MLDFGWIFLPTTSYIILTVAVIIYMVKFKDDKQDIILWVFNVMFFLLIVTHYTFNLTNRVFINIFSLMALLLSIHLFNMIRKERNRET